MDNGNQQLTAEIVASYVSHNAVRADELPGLIQATYSALSSLGQPQAAAEPEHKPAVSPRRSVTPDFIVSLIDGRQYKSLKRHLSGHGLTPQQYRERYGLKADYPMVAASYAAQRSELAKSLGLGRKRSEASATAPAPKKRARTAKNT